jgi:hypothetical protein
MRGTIKWKSFLAVGGTVDFGEDRQFPDDR